MNIAEFEATIEAANPPEGLSMPLKALWHAEKGEWDRAHAIVQDDEGEDAAWIHAYLHREEGDLSNARYWYRRAGKPEATVSLDDEWKSIVNHFLAVG